MHWVAVLMVVASACSTAATQTTTSEPGASATSTTTSPPSNAPSSEMAGTSAPTSFPASSTSSVVVETTTASGVTPVGFDTVSAVVTKPDGTICELCLWLADTADQRSRGLMTVTDLGDADGMAFVYPEPRTGTFWMSNTPLPLSIAFFDPDGVYLDDFDMDTCEPGDCPNYDTPTDFLVAVEVPQGDLATVGIVPGSTLELLNQTCDATR